MFHNFMRTAAWLDLDATARAIYVEMAAIYAGPGSNNGRIRYSVRDAAANLHIGKSTASRALKRLETHGFIVTVRKGAFSWKLRHATEWRLTEFSCDVTGQLATRDFLQWTSQIQNSVPSQTSKVPMAKPTGIPSGTEALRTPENGTHGGTKEPVAPSMSVSRQGHL